MGVQGDYTFPITVEEFLNNPYRVVLKAVSDNKIDLLLDALYYQNVSFHHLADLIHHEVVRQVELGIRLAELGYGPRSDWQSELEKEGFGPIGTLGLKALSIAKRTKRHKKIWEKVREELRNERLAGKVERELSTWASREFSDIIELVYGGRLGSRD